MNKGWYYDEVTKKLYRWDVFIKLLKGRNGDTKKLYKKES